MQRHVPRHLTAYTITALVYLLIVAWFYYSKTHHFVSSQKPKESVIKMSLSAFVPEIIAPPKKVIEKKVIEKIVEPPKEELAKEEPEPIKERVVEEKVVAKPVIKKHIIKKQEKKKIEKKKTVKKPVIKKQKTKNKKVKKKTETKKQVSSKESKSSSKAEKNKFWTAVRKKIDTHKFYPRIAKKRRMEGSVKVKFTILRSGKVANISVQGPRVFLNSARNAVKSAFPMNVNKSPVSLPTSINITLNYKVR